ncbi:MAG TPA: ParB/RepB/Spo0J family partition protein, partial [Variovorax sp.]|nr:ParB/RepB/Spo0J family partition protein [Variovorax sp.]
MPLDRLTLSEANVRTVRHEDGLDELAALIASQGLLQRLCVVAGAGDRYAVVAGGRRLRAMALLVQRGAWAASQPVECRLFDEVQALEVSIAENSGREAMHPADQMAAFRRLIEGGASVAQVAGRFGVSALTVERRLRLSRLAPRFLDLYRADQIAPEQLMALALVDDPAAQEAAWDGLAPYERSAWRIRSLLTHDACPADSRLARFVGLAAYEAAGGAVRRDLFSSPDDLSGVFLEDAGLVQTLALAALRERADAVQAEGWAWVECALETDLTALRRHGRLAMARRDLTAEEAQALETLAAEQRVCAEACEAHEEAGDPEAADFEAVGQRLAEALEAADDQLAAAEAGRWTWTPEQRAHAGAVVRLDARGEVQVERGLLRPGDRPHRASAGTASDEECPPRDEVDPARIRPEFSEKLMRDLTAHRTAALQAALVQNPRVALVTLVHRLAETVFGLYGPGDDVVKVLVRPTGDALLGQEASDYAASPAAEVLGVAETEWGDRLPGSPAVLFDWLLVQETDTLMGLLAYCTARSVNAVAARAHATFNQGDALAQALGLDMADWWCPTPACYLAQVSKAKALDAVREATGVDA